MSNCLIIFDHDDDDVVTYNDDDDDDDGGDGVVESKTRVFAAIVEMLRWFAGPQIRNTAVNPTFDSYLFYFLNKTFCLAIKFCSRATCIMYFDFYLTDCKPVKRLQQKSCKER